MSGGDNGDGATGQRSVNSPNRALGARSASPAKRTAADMESSGAGHVPGSFSNDGSNGPTHFDQEMTDVTGPSSTNGAHAQSQSGSAMDTQDEENGGADGEQGHSIDERVAQVYELASKPLDEGQRGYVVSRRWLDRVESRTSANLKSSKFSKEAREGPIGPVDNSDIVSEDVFDTKGLIDAQNREYIPLNRGLLMKDDFEVLPEKAWGLVVSWYGIKKPQRQIERFAHNTTDEPGQNIMYELYPPVITIRKVPHLGAETSDTPKVRSMDQLRRKSEERMRGQTTSDDAIQLVTSRTESFQRFLRRSKEAAGIPMETKVRLFRLLRPSNVSVEQPNGQDAGVMSPPQSRPASPTAKAVQSSAPKLVMSANEFQKLEIGKDMEHLDVPDGTNNAKFNGGSSLGTFAITESQVIVLEEQIGGPAGGEFASDKKKLGGRLLGNKNGSKPASTTTSGRTSPAPGGMMTRGRTRRDGRTRGTVGLVNLGNTCYMNSALQCIRSVEELAVFFLSEQYKKEINASNPLGHRGVMAKQYAGVLQGIYSDTNSGAFSPQSFKKTLGSIQPMFSGWGQQDSQEFLSFLVDALHEDLNRIEKKPYNENPDSDDKTVGDPQAIIELGEVYRQNHRARNDSVAMDLFSGFYKNTMECPVCDKISITFDPYSLLTVQLPIESSFRHTITFVPLHGRPVNYLLDIDKHASIRGVKQHIASKRPGLSADRLWLAEVYQHKLYKVFFDTEILSEANINTNDYVFMYELPAVPSNAPEPPKRRIYGSILSSRNDEEMPAMDSAKADQFAVPIFMRGSPRGNAHSSFELHPLYIMVTREEAKDYDIILKKILIAVANLTSRPILTEFHEPANAAETSLDGEKVNGSEDGAGVSDHSVPSDDGYVQVSVSHPTKSIEMQESSSTSDVVAIPANFMDPDYHIVQALRESLFTLGFTKSSDGPHCTGLNSLETGRVMRMSERVKQTKRRGSDASTSSQESNVTSSTQVDGETGDGLCGDEDGTDTVEEDDVSNAAVEAEDDDEELPDVVPRGADIARSDRRRNNGKSNKFGGKKGKKGKKFGKKKKGERRARVDKPQRSSGAEMDVQDDSPYYIKAGEGIVLDWTPEGADALFGADKDPEDSLRGRYMSTDDGRGLPYVDDPVLKAKEEKRAERKKHGVTLDDCFVETGKREILSEDNAWYCNRCKEMRQAAKTLEIWTIPEILIVHLKRFGGNRSFRDKVDVFVDYPVEGLDLTERIGLKEDGKEYIYDLFAVDNHYGGLGGGHYTALAKNFCDGQWYDYNDSSCNKISESKLHSAAAYLLFYRRRSEKPLGPQYLQDLVTSFRNPAPTDTTDDNDEADSGEVKLGGPIFSLRGSPSASGGAGAAVENPLGLDGGVGAGVGNRLTQSPTMETTRTDLGHINGRRIFGPERPSEKQYGAQGSSWSFANLSENSRSAAEEDNTDAASTAADRHSDYESMDGGSTGGYAFDSPSDPPQYSGAYSSDEPGFGSSPSATDIHLDDRGDALHSKMD